MRRTKEILRTSPRPGLDQRQIARSCSLAVSTVHEHLKRAIIITGSAVASRLPIAVSIHRRNRNTFNAPSFR
jgi:DNA-binding NarL/FixJ family response regulator